jgi:hypothetical protein
MSVELWVFHGHDKLPTVERWSQSFADLGLPYRPQHEGTLDRLSGYLPLTSGDSETVGFELTSGPLEDDQRAMLVRRRGAGAFDRVAILSFTDEDELLPTAAGAATLALLTGGLLYDPNDEDGRFVPAAKALAWLKKVRAELDGSTTPAEQAQAVRENATGWRNTCLQLAQAVHREYAVNRERKGNYIEFVRPLESGLWVSHNFFYRRRDIQQGFAVMFTRRETGPWLHSPFVLGDRRAHLTVREAFQRHLGIDRPRGVHSNYGGWRSNTFELVALCMRNAEDQLLPAYLDRLRQGHERLARVFQTARVLIEDLQLGEPVKGKVAPTDLEKLRPLGIDPAAVAPLLDRYIPVTANEIAVGSPDLDAIPPAIRDVFLAVRQLDQYVAVRDELPALIDLARALGRTA